MLQSMIVGGEMSLEHTRLAMNNEKSRNHHTESKSKLYHIEKY